LQFLCISIAAQDGTRVPTGSRNSGILAAGGPALVPDPEIFKARIVTCLAAAAVSDLDFLGHYSGAGNQHDQRRLKALI